MSGGITAPPTMAITRNDEPDLVWAPRPRRLMVKMVGNWIDMKKLGRHERVQPDVAAGDRGRDAQRDVDGGEDRQQLRRAELRHQQRADEPAGEEQRRG